MSRERSARSPTPHLNPERGRLVRALRRHYGIVVTVLKENLAYRFEFFTAFFITLIMVVLVRYLWEAVYRSGRDLGMSLQELITYVCVAQVVSFTRMGAAQRRSAYSASHQIANGDVILDLVRPVDYQARNFSASFGQFMVEMLIVNLPAYAFALLVVGISTPPSVEAAIGFLVSLLIGFALSFSFDFLITILSFWTMTTYGLMMARKALVDILSGTLIPLALFPGWLRSIASVLPFRGMASIPLSIYVGEIKGSAIVGALGEQLLWVAVMLLLTRVIWHFGSRKLTVQGG